MIDDKFINDFIVDAENISLESTNRYIIRGYSKDLKYVTHPKAEWIGDIEGAEFKKLLSVITNKDKVFIHWYDLPIAKTLLSIDLDIPLYVPLWGGEFYEEPLLVNKQWLFDKLTLKYVNKRYLYPRTWARRPDLLLRQLITIYNKKKKAGKEFELKRKTIQRINYLLLYPNTNEADFIRKSYQANNIVALPFSYNQNFDLASQIRPQNTLKNQTTIIRIGNSATETNNHLDIFAALEKFKNEEIKVEVPLSYGETDYATEVKNKGFQHFKNKFYPLENFISREEYIQQLNNVDVAIMFHNRQQALGNCVALLTLGKKLYLKKNNPLYSLFKKIGVNVFDASIINTLSYKDFVEPLSQNEVDTNIEILKRFFSANQRQAYLKNIL
ncbi:TDP-N-acetylfucosamine:lipid II N-acetylfucosaminyltransferase [Ferruginibacter albus]|uniref:TDP-N-acetylfucosamine:lipid II N-acetylfucosaminyltransferase n=1 Tax=Ferruginibacter albus TaxID=2875540 RepID=UPI001CC44964|nr:TDP-N-acetylfucosamine:lipid II N-acetylfucosaminyltransferase [Ferruginibacter albus]UAY50698.1 TDP-N-acetylfucosamine:lipid II N-acetylfucosaminyltransferase [Ferruginibacter albus]